MQYGPARTVEQSATRIPVERAGRRVGRGRHGAMVAARPAGRDAAAGTPSQPESGGLARMPAMSDPRPLTLMTVHAHPDDETIGTGGVMAKAVADGHRVVLVTCTRGELGEIVVPELDTPDNHRRLGEIRAGELEAAMAAPRRHRVGEPRLPRLGHDGPAGQPSIRAASGRPTSTRRSAGWSGWSGATGPDVITTYNEFGGYGHPDHIRTHVVAIGAFERAGDPAWLPGAARPEHGGTGPAEADGGLAPWTPSKLYEQAIPASVRERMNEALAAAGRRSFWMPPEDATPEQMAEFEEFAAKMLVPDEAITTRVDVGPYVEAKWAAIHEHRTQISDESPFMLLGLDGWRRWWSMETFILREARVPVELPETDLFAGLG